MPAFDPFCEERVAALDVPGLDCRACARRAERTILRAAGVTRAAIARGDGQAHVAYDARTTDEASIIEALAEGGYRARPSGASSERAPIRRLEAALAAGLIALGGSLALSILAGAEPSRAIGLAKLGLATFALFAGGASLFDRRLAPRRALPDRETIALVAAGLAFLAGAVEIAFVSHGAVIAPSALRWFGFHASAWRARPAWGLEAATAIVVATLVVKRAALAVRDHASRDLEARRRERERAIRRVDPEGAAHWISIARLAGGDRVRLTEGDAAPLALRLEASARFSRPGGLARIHREGELVARGSILLSSEVDAEVTTAIDPREVALDALTVRALAAVDRRASSQLVAIAGRAVTLAGIAFAVFAFLVHALFGGGALAPTTLFATVAVLAAFSASGCSSALPALERIAILRARRLRSSLSGAAAIDALARAVRTRRLAVLVIAAAYNAIVLPAAVLGWITPILAAAFWLVESLVSLAIVARFDVASAASPAGAAPRVPANARVRRAEPTFARVIVAE